MLATQTLVYRVAKSMRIRVDRPGSREPRDPDGLRLIGKGKRKPEVELRWHDLPSGDAAMAIALDASLAKAAKAATKPAAESRGKPNKPTARKR